MTSRAGTIVLFGHAFTTALTTGAASLGVPVAWVLGVLALESGLDPMAANRSGARGLWQCMPVNGRPYLVSDPAQQMRDAVAFWSRFSIKFETGTFRSREAFYCLNLAPARLIGGEYHDDTIVYSTNMQDRILNPRGARFAQTFWPEAYRQNARAFGLDPLDAHGRIRMRDLAVGLDAGIRRCRARYDAELAAASPPTHAVWLGEVDHAPDMRDRTLSEVDYASDDEPPPDVA
jgi:hypothetical protein